jgi:hypothetical protein
LKPPFEEVLRLLQEIRTHGTEVVLEHIYREFNHDADAAANAALDERSSAERYIAPEREESW